MTNENDLERNTGDIENPFSGLSGDIKERLDKERIENEIGDRQIALDFIRIFRIKERLSILKDQRDSIEVMLSGPLFTKTLHKDPVTSVAFISESACASVGMDQRIQLWQPMSDENPIRLEQTAYQGYLTTDEEKTILACGSLDKTVQIWEIPSGKYLKTLDLGGFGVTSLALDPSNGTIATGLYNGSIRISDLDTLETRTEFRAHENAVTSIAFSSSGINMVSGGVDGSVNVWRPSTDSHIAGINEFDSPVTCVKLLGDERSVIIASQSKQIQKWDSHQREITGTFSGHSGEVYAVTLSPDGILMASSSKDNTIRIWDVESCVERKTLRGNRGRINDVRFSSDGEHLLSGNSEGEVSYWGVQLDVTKRVLDIVEEMLVEGGFNVRRTRKQTIIISLMA